MTLICVPIFVNDPESALADATEARDRGADLVEFRIDGFYSGRDDENEVPAVLRLVARCPLPCIVTCRPVLEGGQYDGPDDARVSLYERLGTAQTAAGSEHPPTYVDVELATYARSENIRQKINLAVDHPGQVRDVSTGLVLSSHDFQTRPEDLFRRINRMVAEPACRVAKVAYRARSLRDNLELLDILAEARAAGKAMIALGMGPYGVPSRVLAPKFEAFLTFATLRAEAATAPGQPTIDELLQLYRFRSIGPSTRVYGVIGHPVEHSISPAVHNAGFEAVGHDGVYLLLPIQPEFEQFKATLLSLIDHPSFDLCGCSVTIPHKEHLLRLALEQYEEGDGRWHTDNLARVCGAANTLVIRRDRSGRAERIDVLNTDGPAAAAALELALGDLRSHRVVVLGAGGTARAVAASVLERGGQVVIINRTPDRAARLADELRAHFAPAASLLTAAMSDLPDLRPDAVFNCTAVGMTGGPGPGQSPVPDELLGALPRHSVIADSVYSPLTTPLLASARQISLQTIDGLALFVGQAALQFQVWTDRPAPRGLFTQVAREILESRAAQAGQ